MAATRALTAVGRQGPGNMARASGWLQSPVLSSSAPGGSAAGGARQVVVARGVTSGKNCRSSAWFTDPKKLTSFNQPISGQELPRCGGIASMFRLPIHHDTEGLHACFVGVPFDNGTTNRNGARFGPRKIRTESVLVRAINSDTGAVPYRSINVGDVGDICFNMFDIKQACEDIRGAYTMLIAKGCKPLTMGGDHTITYPILQAFKEKYGRMALIHVDAHTDTYGAYMGANITHGTTFRLAVEEDLLDTSKVIQIGIRGSSYNMEDPTWGRDRGFRVVPAQQCWYKSLTPLMEEVREQMGDAPVYISFDIDGIDPSFCPGTGTPEIGGLTMPQALEIIRGVKGLNVVGCDLVEVSPPYDPSNLTALTAANLLFEMLCILPEVKHLKNAYE